MTKRNKLLVTILCLACVLCALVSGTIAWLISASGPITNTFTPSNVKVDLTEGDFKGKMIPGATIDKVATVKVTSDIDCYVFVEATESDNLDDFIAWNIVTGWTQLEDSEGNKVAGVYYRVVTATATEEQKTFGVVENGKVTVKNTVNKDMMDALYADTSKYPTLTFNAYAIQKEGFASAEAAWAAIPNN